MQFWKRKLKPFIRQAEAGDIDAIATMHAASFARGWSNGEISALMDQAQVFCLVLVDEDNSSGPPLGFILARMVADEAEVLSIATDPGHRRQGIARHLMQAAIRNMQTERMVSLFLEVAEDNVAAVSLYKHLGFANVGRRDSYYSAGNETVSKPEPAKTAALVMRLNLI